MPQLANVDWLYVPGFLMMFFLTWRFQFNAKPTLLTNMMTV